MHDHIASLTGLFGRFFTFFYPHTIAKRYPDRDKMWVALILKLVPKSR